MPRRADRAGWPISTTTLVLALAGIALTGCQAPPQPAGPTTMVLHVPDYETFFDASCTTLRRHDFPPDRLDRLRGLIVSHPTTSGQWFEWWRADSRGGYQIAESSLHTMRRMVTVTLEPLELESGQTPATPALVASTGPAASAGDEPPESPLPSRGRYRLTVQVDKSRYSAPERQITTASGALALYSERTPTVEGLRGPRSRFAHWVPLGRDALLEEFLLGELGRALPDYVLPQP